MPCQTVNLPDGGTAIVCFKRGKAQKCTVCGKPATKECDFVIRPADGKRAAKTCDKPLCDRCAISIGSNLDHCPAHHKSSKVKEESSAAQSPAPPRKSLQWSTQQTEALNAVGAWMRKKDRQVFYLAGFAGTGKTELAKHIGRTTSGDVVYGAFTGKAALVMASKGCVGASTIHSLIYTVKDDNSGVPKFIRNPDSPVAHASLCIIDEISLVDDVLGPDLLSFGTPVLVIGDPEQLPPVSGTGFFTSGEPDFMLTEVHRQALDNPIIRMSMDVREGRGLQYTPEGACRVITRSEIDARQVLDADQVLVGRNMTRRTYNTRIRQLRGFKGITPTKSERLVCLKNNRNRGLLNGGLWNVRTVREANELDTTMVVTPHDAGGVQAAVKVTVRNEFFQGREQELPWEVRRYSDEFDFGYALTVHKAQGSQWDNVVLFDESAVFREDRRRWLYTGLTRAAQKITVVQP